MQDCSLDVTLPSNYYLETFPTHVTSTASVSAQKSRPRVFYIIYIYMVSPPRSRSSTKEGCHGILPGSQQLRCLREHFKTGGLRIQRRFSLVSFRCCHLFFIARTCRLTNGTLDNLHRRYVCQHEKICQRISAGKPTTEPCS